MDEGVLIGLRDLRFSYGEKEVLRGITLDIHKGLFHGLVGPNGCGKTTLLDLILGAKAPQAGRVLFQGRDVRRYSRRELARKMALVPQEYHTGFSFTVEEVVLMGRHPHRAGLFSYGQEDREIADRVMEKMELLPFKERFIPQLSGGEKQRVVFARAVAQQTPVLLLDEATSNMDVYHTLLCLGQVRQEVREGKCTVVATFHDLNLASQFSDSLIFMKDGHILAHGPVEEVLTPDNVTRALGVPCSVYESPLDRARQVVFKSHV